MNRKVEKKRKLRGDIYVTLPLQGKTRAVKTIMHLGGPTAIDYDIRGMKIINTDTTVEQFLLLKKLLDNGTDVFIHNQPKLLELLATCGFNIIICIPMMTTTEAILRAKDRGDSVQFRTEIKSSWQQWKLDLLEIYKVLADNFEANCLNSKLVLAYLPTNVYMYDIWDLVGQYKSELSNVNLQMGISVMSTARNA